MENDHYHLYYNYEKYPLSPLKPRFLVLIEQYLPNISDPVYSVHQSFMWFLWLNWCKSTFNPVTAPNDSKYWPIVTSSIHEPATSNCDVTMTDCYRVVAMDAFLEQWCWGQWFKRDQIVAAGYHEKCKRHYFATPRVSTRGITSYNKYVNEWRKRGFTCIQFNFLFVIYDHIWILVHYKQYVIY